MQLTTPSIDVRTFAQLFAQPASSCILIDVRESDEHARERIDGATLIPLASLTPRQLAEHAQTRGATRVVVHCKSGGRSGQAAARCQSLANEGIEVLSLDGGITAWKAAGFPTVVDSSRVSLSIMQQTHLVAGGGVFLGTALGYFVRIEFLAIPAFIGAGLLLAGATGWCGMALILAKMPWNRAPRGAAASCKL